MLNISFEKVISLSKKYDETEDAYSWHRVEFLAQIVSIIIRTHGTPSKFTFTAGSLNGKEIVEICREIFKDLEIPVKLKARGKSRAVFTLM